MPDDAKAKQVTDLAAIRNTFFKGVPLKEAQAEIKALTPEEKAQLGDAIRNGSYNY